MRAADTPAPTSARAFERAVERARLVPDAAEEWVVSLIRPERRRDDLAATLMYIRLVYQRTGAPLTTQQVIDGLGLHHGKSARAWLRTLVTLGLIVWEPWQSPSIRPLDLREP